MFTLLSPINFPDFTDFWKKFEKKNSRLGLEDNSEYGLTGNDFTFVVGMICTANREHPKIQFVTKLI